MVSMQEKGLFENGEYFVVGVDVEQYDQDYPGKYLKGLLKEESEESAKLAFRSYVGVVGSPPVGFENFTVKVNNYMETPPFNFPNLLTQFGGMKRIRAEAAYLYDAVQLYATALNETLAMGENPFDGRTVLKSIIGRTYRSAMGYSVYMDKNGDAEGNYTLTARKPIPFTTNEFGLYPVGVFQLNENDNDIPILRLTGVIDWIGDGPPVDEPTCGFRGQLCFTYTSEIAAGVGGGVLFVLIFVTLAVYRNWKYEQELDNLLWKIDYKDVQVNEYTPTNGSVEKPTKTNQSLIGTSQVSLSSNPDSDFRYSTIYTQIGTYKGRIFAIKKVNRKHVDITRKLKKELKTMRDLRHDNLNAFLGACVDPPNICIITEYCARGSLKDILENDGVKLDNMFISSLVGDIVRGMIYLHDSPVRSHGNLKPTKCLVDSRWVLKIADYGLFEFKEDFYDGGSKYIDSCRNYESLLYTAPELLRDPNGLLYGTQKGDVYSFSLVLYEIHSRHGPYGRMDLTAAEIVKKVLNGENQKTGLFRPQMELLENPFDAVRDCLKQCWAETPDDRPDFKAIRHRLRPMWKGMKPNIFDNMIAMMEKYANNLEALVDERTDQLIEEKKKTEALLYEMLPRYVAEQLKHGHKVEAESFDSVTIFFSDIVGFTTMSAESTPLQVVDLLNDLYTCFDSIIENYDVYKVETIGDAYMVVSGLPIRNGDQHAGEIASMSLGLLEAITRFKIRHRPYEKLMLRIGIHSGPVCAGVVGLKMPRYCLFGDTVNTSSRMESSGLPLKIHCSEECEKLLRKLSGYHLEDRGIVKIKGKGEMRTFWLSGEDADRKQKHFEQRQLKLKKLQEQRSNNHYQPPQLQQQLTPSSTTGVLTPSYSCNSSCQGYANGYIHCPRSSLKNVCVNKSPVSRTISLDSPKKLRFAKLEPDVVDPMIDGHAMSFEEDSELFHHRESVPVTLDNCSRRLSIKRNSCPCIKNMIDSMDDVFGIRNSDNHENCRCPSKVTNCTGRLVLPAACDLESGSIGSSSLFVPSPVHLNDARHLVGDCVPLLSSSGDPLIESSHCEITVVASSPSPDNFDISFIDCSDRETPV
ncbi:hypothetical protein CHUAL_003395 [Chamberlinius hualienensis]